MLHRAATTAYSWWWASHIRTKQSKWLEQNLQDMEEKVQFMLKIIEQEGDSFAKRAEMYYKKRPELVSSVEESYKSYRALAERFDHISKDLQSANRTIATVFPEQVQLGLDTDDDDASSLMLGSSKPSNISPNTNKNMPKPPKLPYNKQKSMLVSRREQLRRNVTSNTIITSGLSKDEAYKEIDSLHKDILTWQTEKEFMKTSYESTLARFLELESMITDSQGKVCSLQDEFGVGTVMEDHEARSLMVGSALKSCTEAMAKLQEHQQNSMEEVKQEYERIKQAHERLSDLKNEEGVSEVFGDKLLYIDPEEGEDVDALRHKIREQLRMGSDSVFTEPEMADKIDDLVDKIVYLETTVCSYNALVKTLRLEIDALLGHITTLEEQKQPIPEGSAMSLRLRELEEELLRVNMLNKDVLEQRKNISDEITEAGCNLDFLEEKMHGVKPEVDGEVHELEGHKEDIESDSEKLQTQPQETKDELEEENVCGTTESKMESELRKGEEEDGLNWRQLYLNNMEDREKILIEDYRMVFKDYKDMKMKLSELEKKHRDQVFEMASHVRELRNSIAQKDEEIQLLVKKLGDENTSLSSKKEEDDSKEKYGPMFENDAEYYKNIIAAKDEEIRMLRKKISELLESHGVENREEEDGLKKQENQNDSSLDKDRKPLFYHLYDRDDFIKEVTNSTDSDRKVKINDLSTQSKAIAGTKGRFRVELDTLLEGNLDFWLRFSTSIHQIQKLQSSIRDLQADLMKLKTSQKQGDKTHQAAKSDARPLYKHLREIQTEVTLWLEHSSVFQEELNSRFSSLNKIQDEITKVSSGKLEEEKELSHYQAAKFHGEILNMKHENSKVAEELQAGVHRAKSFKHEVTKLLSKLDKEFGFSEQNVSYSSFKNPFNKPRIPLHSFLFGVKLRRQHKQRSSMLACVTPTIPKLEDKPFDD